MEIWKDIKGFEGYYQVSNLGRVKSLDRTITYVNGKVVNLKGKIISTFKMLNGYLTVNLRKNNKLYKKYIHRLVASAFIKNEYNYPCINHKDETRDNNVAENLEWCTYKYNNNYGSCIEKRKKNTDYKNRKKNFKNIKCVYQYDIEGNLIKKYKSANEVFNILGYSEDGVRKCCNNVSKTYKGFVWQYNTISKEEIKLKTTKNINKGGWKLSEETKNKISRANKGKKRNEQFKIKLSKSKKKMVGDKNPKSKNVLCIETNKIYNGTREVERLLNICSSSISQCCNGKLKTAGGYHWKYVEVNKNE